MKLHLKYLIPSVFEVAGAGFLTFAVVLLANSKQLLNYYGLQSSNQVLQSNAGDAVRTALGRLDTFKGTDQVVTFAIWAVVGMVCFSIVQGLGRAYREFEFEEELSSRRYVHPSTFTKSKFWKGVLEDFAGLAVGLVMVGVGVYAFLAFVLPIGLTYSRLFLFSINLSNAAYFLLGLLVVFFGLVILSVCARVLLQRRRIIANNQNTI